MFRHQILTGWMPYSDGATECWNCSYSDVCRDPFNPITDNVTKIPTLSNGWCVVRTYFMLSHDWIFFVSLLWQKKVYKNKQIVRGVATHFDCSTSRCTDMLKTNSQPAHKKCCCFDDLCNFAVTFSTSWLTRTFLIFLLIALKVN
jgi:hypothetical protein